MLLDQLDLHSQAAKPVLQTIARLPRNIRAEAARGLSAEQPIPDYGIQSMNRAAFRIGHAVASRWNVLPLTIRYTAAESTVRHGGRRGGTLADLATDGDPIAAAAVADAELERLLVVLPIDEHRHRIARNSSEDAEIAENRRRSAEHLAEQLSPVRKGRAGKACDCPSCAWR
jgi:hypothetical protein